MVRLGKQWKQNIMEMQMAVPMFLQLCRNLNSSRMELPHEFKGFDHALNKFYIKFAEQHGPLRVQELHFFLNNLLVTAEQICARSKERKFHLEIKCLATFERNVRYLFNSGLAEICNGEYAEMQNRQYPSTILMNQLIEAIFEDSDLLPPKIQLNKEVIPIALDGLSRECVEGMWILIARARKEEAWQSIFGARVSGDQQLKVYRYVMFYSRIDGPAVNHFWDLEGAITFDFGGNSTKTLEFTWETSMNEIRQTQTKADKVSELLPEPYCSTPEKRFFNAVAEDWKEDKILKFW